MFTTFGALTGLILAIALIAYKVTPVYALVLGALSGGLLSGAGLSATIEAMMSGAEGMMPCILRILASGILVGALVKTGSATKIADSIVSSLGSKFALTAIALATMIVCAVGVFADIAVITVAPVALAVGRRAKLSIPSLLVAMVGGSKAGNVISPNPNTIAVAEAFGLDLTSVIIANIIPAICALSATIILSEWLAGKRTQPVNTDTQKTKDGINVWQALAGPLAVIILLASGSVFGTAIDPLVALPVGGLVSIIVCGQWRNTIRYAEYGLSNVSGVSILLIGTGTIAGIVSGSGLNSDMIRLLNACHMPIFVLAPLSSALLSAATASTAASVTIAAQTFSGPLLDSGIAALPAAAMLHAGGTILDSLPHGSFFHATAEAVGMNIKDRLKTITYEAIIGSVTTIISVCLFLLQ